MQRDPHHPSAARHRADLQRLAAGSRAADADEQPRSRGRRAARRPHRLRRLRQGGAQLAGVRRHRPLAAARSSTTKRCWCSRASPSASSARIQARRACSSPTRCWCRRGRRGRTSAISSTAGLTMYGQMTAGSWIYIGSQGILQGTYETLAAVGAPALRRHARGPAGRHRRPRRHGRRAAAGRDDERRRRRSSSRSIRSASSAGWRPRYLDEATDSLDDGARRGRRAWTRDQRGAVDRPRANAADVLPALVARGIVPDVLTDQTSAHDALNGYVPNGMSLDEADRLRERRSRRSTSRASMAAMADHVRAMLDAAGARRRDVRLRQQHPRAGAAGGRRRRVRHSRLRARSTSGRSSARARGRSAGRRSPAIPTTSASPTTLALEMFPHDEALRALDSRSRASACAFQGLPARICWLGYGERARFGLRINELVRDAASSRRRSSSAAITSTPARSPRRTARPKACATAATPSPTGRS